MSKRLNILHISTPKSWRGGEQQLAYLFDELNTQNQHQILLCRKDSEIAQKGKAKGWEVLEQPKKTAVDLVFAARIGKVCREHKIDLIHTHDAHAHTFAILSAVFFGNKTPLVVSRRVDFPIKPTRFSRFKYNHPIIKRILCVSDAIKAITATDIKNKSVLITVHSGIDLGRFKYDKKDCTQLRTEFGISADIPIVGNVAAIAPHKDYFTFIATVKLLKKQGLKAKYFIIGDGPMRDEIVAKVHTEGLSDDIFFTGFRKNIPEILPELDVFLITSETEGLGTSVIDAFACKVPVVATRAGGIPELVKDNFTGITADVKDAKGLAEGVTKILNGAIDLDAIAKNQIATAEKFSKAATAEKTLAEYYSLLKENADINQ